MFDWQIPGYEPTPNELRLEELEQPPSRLSLLCGAAADRVLWTRAPTGADRLSHPPRTTPDGLAGPSGVTHPTEETP